MNTKQITSLTAGAAFIVLLAAPSFSQSIPAFPGAEGFGKWAAGGRGGEVYFVTSLADNGTGTLRGAIENRNKDAWGAVIPRTVIFRVAGTIRLTSRLRMNDGRLTIAGQSAPYGGVCISRSTDLDGKPLLWIYAPDVIIRNIRFRIGPNPTGERLANASSLWIKEGADSVIVDHCSFSWATDENLSIVPGAGPIRNITIQNSIISEGLYCATHWDENPAEYCHSMGGFASYTIERIAFYRNLFASNNGRNPWVATTHDSAVVECINNIVYNWQGKSPGGNAMQFGRSGGVTRANSIGNYFKGGPSTLWSDVPREIRAGLSQQVYLKDNLGPHRTHAGIDEKEIGVWSDQTVFASKPFPHEHYTRIQRADSVYADVCAHKNIGATRPRSDTVDIRILTELASGSPFKGTQGKIIDDPSEVGGWPDLAAYGDPPYNDSDRDGMADTWEKATGLDLSQDDHNGHDLHAGYTNLEVFLQYLAGDIASEPDPPTVAFTQPTETTITEPADLGVVVEAIAPGGSIDNVKLYLNDTFVRQENNTPYEWGTASATADDSALLGLTAGTYTLRVVATDANGTTASDTMEITVEPAAVGVRGEALRLSPVAADHAPQVFDLRGKRIMPAAFCGRTRRESRALTSMVRGVFVVRTRRNAVVSARILVLDETK